MRLLYSLTFLALAGCPPPMHYVVAEVASPRAPVADALVAADCGVSSRAALRTDEAGRARLPIAGRFDAARCVLTVAKPGYWTVEASGVNTCTAAGACPATEILLEEHAAPRAQAPRSYRVSPSAEIAR